MSDNTVTWRREAEDQLMVLWIRASNKEAITGYAQQIESILGRNPNEQGESRNAGTRLAFFRPLCVRYLVDEENKRVSVIALKWVGR